MASAILTPCARCSLPLRPDFRFCPACAFPQTDDGVLSTQIEEVRTKVAQEERSSLGRLVVPGVWVLMTAFVGAVGWFVFDPSARDQVLELPPPSQSPIRVQRVSVIEPEWTTIAFGSCFAGPPNDKFPVRIPKFSISRYEITNQEWLLFLQDEAAMLQSREIWEEAFPGTDIKGWSLDDEQKPVLAPGYAQLPVRNISGTAAMMYANWLTRKIDIPGVRVRLPHEGEWEYAARGDDDRIFPWGVRFWARPERGTGTVPRNARIGIDANSPLVVSTLNDDISFFLVMGMGSNVSEWVLQAALESESREAYVPPERKPGGPALGAEGTVFRYVLPSLDGGVMPRTMNIRGASFRDELHEPTPFELTELEETDLELRGVPRHERAEYTKSPTSFAVDEEQLEKFGHREDALTSQLERIVSDLQDKERVAEDLQERMDSAVEELLDAPSLQEIRREIEDLGSARRDTLFLRARMRERLMDWAGAADDYKEWLDLSGSSFLVPSIELDPVTELVRQRRKINRRNADTRQRALVWEQRTVDSSQKFVHTGFRLVRFALRR